MRKLGRKPRTKEQAWKYVLSRAVRENECLIVHKGTSVKGYRVIHVNGKSTYLHRLSYEMHHGSIDENLFVLHSCDRRNCIEPTHLRQGTAYNNAYDTIIRQRHPQGEKHYCAKLTEENVSYLRSLTSHQLHRSIAKLARTFNVDESTIRAVLNDKTWKTV